MKTQNLQILRIPEIYKKVYWSGFLADDKAYSEEIINNRIKFIQEFDIVKVDTTQTLKDIRWKLENSSVPSFFDHLEFYRTKSGGVVVLNSPYGVGILECPGMLLYDKMYHVDANTFIQSFDTLNDVKQWAKTLTAHGFIR